MNTKEEKKVVNLIDDYIAAREVFDIIYDDINRRRLNILKHTNPGATLKTISQVQAKAKFDAYSNIQDQLAKLRQQIRK